VLKYVLPAPFTWSAVWLLSTRGDVDSVSCVCRLALRGPFLCQPWRKPCSQGPRRFVHSSLYGQHWVFSHGLAQRSRSLGERLSRVWRVPSQRCGTAGNRGRFCQIHRNALRLLSLGGLEVVFVVEVGGAAGTGAAGGCRARMPDVSANRTSEWLVLDRRGAVERLGMSGELG